MKITIENIEEWMFDFHEGTLSEADKSELLNFLHNHPEYNEDFARWTQTHALKNEPILVPSNLLEGVLQPIPTPFYGYKFLLGTATGIVLSAAFAGYLWLSKVQDPSLQKPDILNNSNEKIIQVPLTAPIRSSTKSLAKPSKTMNGVPKTELHFHPTLVDSSFEEKVPEQGILLALDTASVIPDTVPSQEQAVSIPATLQKEETATPASAPKKKRKSSPLNIKPQSKFKPANPNF